MLLQSLFVPGVTAHPPLTGGVEGVVGAVVGGRVGVERRVDVGVAPPGVTVAVGSSVAVTVGAAGVSVLVGAIVLVGVEGGLVPVAVAVRVVVAVLVAGGGEVWVAVGG